MVMNNRFILVGQYFKKKDRKKYKHVRFGESYIHACVQTVLTDLVNSYLF